MKDLKEYITEVSSGLLFKAAGYAYTKGQEERAKKLNDAAVKRYEEEFKSRNHSKETVIANDANIREIVRAAITTYGNNVDLNFIDVSNVTNMGSVFIETEFNGDISKWDVSKVKNMDYMFYMSQFNSNISNWDMSHVKSMYSMFDDSEFNGDISNWDVSKVKHYEDIFDGCHIRDEYKPKFK